MLALAEHDGALWASNRFWACRAAYLEPFLREHGIDGPGVYDINGRTVTRRKEEDINPEVFTRSLDLDRYTIPLSNVTIGDHDAIYTQGGEGSLLLLLQRQGEDEPGIVALPAEQVEWLEAAPVQAPDLQVCNMELFATERQNGPVAIIAEGFPDDDAVRELAAILMPMHKPVKTAPCLDCGKVISYIDDPWYPVDGGGVCEPCGETRGIPKGHLL